MLDLRVVRHALARVEEGQRQLVERELGALVEEAHGLGRVDHRAAADGDQQVGAQLVEHLHAGADLRLAGLRLDVGEHVHPDAVEVAADLVGHPARLGVGVGHEHRLAAA